MLRRCCEAQVKRVGRDVHTRAVVRRTTARWLAVGVRHGAALRLGQLLGSVSSTSSLDLQRVEVRRARAVNPLFALTQLSRRESLDPVDDCAALRGGQLGIAPSRVRLLEGIKH